jgi:hypothetical protein
MQTGMQVALEGRAVQEREEEVDAREVEVNKVVDQVRLRKREFCVEAKREAFPLFSPVSWTKRRGGIVV